MTRTAAILPLLAALLPGAAPAETTPELQAAIEICLTPGPSVPARKYALLQRGWTEVPAADAAVIEAASHAFATAELVAQAIIEDGDIDNNLRRLADRQEKWRERLWPDFEELAVLVAPGGLTMRVETRITDIANCVLSANVTADDLAGLLALAPEHVDLPGFAFDRFQTGENAIDAVELITFTEAAFGAPVPQPVLFTPASAITK